MGVHHPIVHNQKAMALLWNPESLLQRLKELEAQAGELKDAPLRRDVRSLGTLLGDVLREQDGEDTLEINRAIATTIIGGISAGLRNTG
jgi:phosphoenolpyruvate carboxylase